MSTRGSESGSERPRTQSSQVAAPEVDIPLLGPLERAEGLVYLGVALMLLLGAVAVLAFTLYSMYVNTVEQGFAAAIITMINDLLLVVIILELMRTILGYLHSHVLSLHPFLIIAAVSATRRILTVGAEMAIEQGMRPEQFNQAIYDLLANAGVVLAVAVALYLTRLGDDREQV